MPDTLSSPNKLSSHPVIAEHQALRELLHEVEQALKARDPQRVAGPDVVAARLDVLRGRLAAHFALEERTRLFEQIEEGTPEHARDCARLRDEHGSFLQRLDGLRAASPEARRATAWSAAIRSLIRDLGRHEERENELLLESVDDSRGAPD